MKIKKSIIVTTIIFGIIATALFFMYLGNIKKQVSSEGETIMVVVAVDNISANVKITDDLVKLEAIPKNSVRNGSYKSVNDVVGQITKSEIIMGEQIIRDRLALDQKGTELAYLIPENMRAMTLPISETSGVAGYINTGDKVDILVSYPTGGGLTTYTQLQNITVLKKGINPEGGVDGDINNSGLTSSLTLLLTPDQAEVLAYAIINGTINLTLRNPTDTAKLDISEYGTANFATWKGR